MTCPAPWILSTRADDELEAPERAAVDAHAEGCTRCRTQLAALTTERLALRSALHAVDEAILPEFAPPTPPKHWLGLGLATAALGAFIETFWSSVDTAVPPALQWLNPLAPRALLDRLLDLVAFIIYEGNAMWTSASNLAGIVAVLGLFAAAVYATRRIRPNAALLASLSVLVLALPVSGHAFEVRKGSLITVEAGETVDDTLFATGDTIAIEGNVNGDLLAFGRTITVRGNVAGDVIAGGETVSIEGSVGGSVIGGARALTLLTARIGRNVYGAGTTVDIGEAAEIGGNAITGGESVTIDGRVSKDLMGAGETLSISGTVEGNVDVFASEINVLPTARVGGNITGRVDSVGDLRIAPGATIGGTTNEQIVEREQRRNPYRTVGYYVGKVIGLATAFVTGLLLLWAFPALRELTLPNALAVLKTGGIGLAAAVTLPVIAALACVTIIGIPLGILIFVIGAAGLYLAKAVLAQIVGRAVFSSAATPPHYALTLLVGLAIATVVMNLPYIGAWASFLITVIGFGLIVGALITRFSARSVP